MRVFINFFFISLLFGQLTEIYNIQYSETQGDDIDCYPSLYEDQENITIRGVVTAVENNGDYHTFFVQDPDSSGPWNGIYVFNNLLEPVIGNFVALTGKVTEYYGLTELGYLSASNVLMPEYPLSPPVVIQTGELDTSCSFESEKYESVLIELQNVTVTEASDNYGQWQVDDGSGPCEIDNMFYSYDAQVNEEILTLIGVVKYSYGVYEINPRDAGDITFAGPPTISDVKISPVLPSEIHDIMITANIVDNGNFTPTLLFSTDGVSWEETVMENLGEDLYEANIPAVGEANITVFYQISVVDEDGMIALYPEDGLVEIFIYPYPYPISALHENNEEGIPLLIDVEVQICGFVSANEFDNPLYMEDGTGGVAIYDFDVVGAVTVGDEICLTGSVTQYLGLTEIINVSDLEIFSIGNGTEPQLVTIDELFYEGAGGIENLEGELVRVNSVTCDVDTWDGNHTYTISDGSGSIELYVDNDTNLPGNPAPANAFDLIGVLGQYDPELPYTSGYQILPRSMADVIFSAGPEIIIGPDVVDYPEDGVTLYWETNESSTGRINYGKTVEYEEGSISFDEIGIVHIATVEGLSSASLYHYEVIAINEEGETSSGDCTLLTVSSGSSGDIEVMFNKEVDHGYAFNCDLAQGNVNLVSRLTERINAAQFSIDVAAYSWSISSLTDALIEAYDRGVLVRFIYDSEHNQDEVSYIEQAGITVITNADGSGSSGIMHNKFLIFDARDHTSEADDFLWTGSLNFTTNGATTNTQNVLLIQDAALALIYTMEFNEMWGSEDDEPNLDLARFGENKLDNTPHFIKVGDTWIYSYFSPSDEVTSRISGLINTSDESLLFCIYSFTKDEIANAMQNQFDNGVEVRGIFDTDIGTGSEWENLSLWADVHLDVEYGVLHHKYLLVDVFGNDPAVLTGSHNWSNAAETVNDENLLIIWDSNIAGQYLQEFSVRYENSAGVSLPVPDIECTLGDLNEDDMVNIIDIVMVVNIVLGQNNVPTDWELCASDADENGSINVLDVVIVVNWALL